MVSALPPDQVVDGPADIVIPGSVVFLAGLGRLVLLLGLIAVVLAVVVRIVRRRRTPERRRPPIVVGIFSMVALLGLGLTVRYWPPAFFVPEFPALPRLLPDESMYYRTVTDVPVSADSERYIDSQGSMPWGPGFSGEVIDGVVFGLPFNFVDSSTPMEKVDIGVWAASSYLGPYPIADPPYIESMPTYYFDMHYLAVDTSARRAWELLSTRSWFGRWGADAGATWSMDSLDYPDGSTIAAGLPLLPGVITVDEVEDGSIDHVLLGVTEISAVGEFVWPARATDGRSEDPDAPPMGSWLRLKADADLSGLGPQARVIAEAAQQYGLVLSDTGPGFALRGTPDRRWNNEDLATLATLSTDDLEVVDSSSLMVSPDSLAVRPAGG